MSLRDWLPWCRRGRQTPPLDKWFLVAWDDQKVTLDVAPPGRDAWYAEFAWNSISRVCFKA